jgi:hypothetical protein
VFLFYCTVFKLRIPNAFNPFVKAAGKFLLPHIHFDTRMFQLLTTSGTDLVNNSTVPVKVTKVHAVTQAIVTRLHRTDPKWSGLPGLVLVPGGLIDSF